MTRRSLARLILGLLAAGAAGAVPAGGSAEVRDRDGLERFAAAHIGPGASPPFSFLYGGKPAAALLRGWKTSVKARDENGAAVTEIVYADPASGLRLAATYTVFRDFPAAEWVLRLRNEGRADTPLIERLQACSVAFDGWPEGELVLHRARGSNAERTDFAPVREVLAPGAGSVFGPDAGRSSDTAALPFFNIAWPGGGIVVAVGWSGAWKASVRREGPRRFELEAGMTATRFKLHPGEEVRTPSIALLFWKSGDRLDGHNLFRRFLLAHHAPRPGGAPLVLPLSHGVGFGGPFPCNEYVCATEGYALAMVERLAQFGLAVDACWIDAGWYESSTGQWWSGVGTWTPSKTNFPRGLKPVTEAAKRHGQGFVVWFEPERVYEGTWLDREHPEWLARLPGNPNRLLDLGNPRALAWLTDHISKLLESEGVTIYRQDFNFDPAPYWKAMDAPDRIGVAEMKHIAGLYAYWDALLAARPGLLIDNCASGGRRIDLETVSRSVPLWRTDYGIAEPNGCQSHTYGLHLFLPFSGTGNVDPQRFNFRSAMGGAVVMGWELNAAFRLNQALEDVAEYKALRPYFSGDFYPLTEHSTSDAAWLALQWNRPEEGDGIVLAFRRVQAPAATRTVALHGLEEGADYEVSFEDYGLSQVKSGRELAAGLPIKIPDAPGSLLLRYRRVR